MATACNFGQIPDIRFKTLCCRGTLIIDQNCDQFGRSLFLDNGFTVDIGGNLNVRGANIDFRNSVADFAGAIIVGFDSDISGNITAGGVITGNFVQQTIFADRIDDIFGDLVGNLNGDILGNVVGNITAINFVANTVQATTVDVANVATVTDISVQTLQSNLCVDPGFAIDFKNGSEFSGNICIPSGTSVTFKNGSLITIETQFGTQTEGDLLYHHQGITQRLPRGKANRMLTSDGSTIVYSNALCLDQVKTNALSTDFLTAGNIVISDPVFGTLTTNVTLVTDGLIANTITATKVTANLCGNLTGNLTTVTGAACFVGEVAFKSNVNLSSQTDFILSDGSIVFDYGVSFGTIDQVGNGELLIDGIDANINQSLCVGENLSVDTINTKGGFNVMTTTPGPVTTVTSHFAKTTDFANLTSPTFANLTSPTFVDTVTLLPTNATITQSPGPNGELSINGVDLVVEQNVTVCEGLVLDAINPRMGDTVNVFANIIVDTLNKKSILPSINFEIDANVIIVGNSLNGNGGSVNVCANTLADHIQPLTRPNCIAYFHEGIAGNGTNIVSNVDTFVTPYYNGFEYITNRAATMFASVPFKHNGLMVPVEPGMDGIEVPVDGGGVYKIDVGVNWLSVNNTPTFNATHTLRVVKNFVPGPNVFSEVVTDQANILGPNFLWQTVTSQNTEYLSTGNYNSFAIIHETLAELDPGDKIGFVVRQETGSVRQIERCTYTIHQVL